MRREKQIGKENPVENLASGANYIIRKSVGFAINVAAVRMSALTRIGGQYTAGNRVRAKAGTTLQAQVVGLLKDRLVIRDIEVPGDIDGLGNSVVRIRLDRGLHLQMQLR